MNLKKSLKKYFGFEDFREKQIQIIKGSLKKWDQLVLLPTGSGKSVCFQLPALLSDGLTIVISPLCSLIKDQVNLLKKKNIDVYSIFSETSLIDKIEICKKIISNENNVKLLYTTPETIDNNLNLMESLHILSDKNKLERFVIDEAHCISIWGNDFRSSYRRLTKLKSKFKQIPITALTATATISVRKDIVNLLQFKQYKQYTKSYYRDNLKIKIILKDTKYYDNMLKILISKKNDSGIIYCNSRKKCEDLTDKLLKDNINAVSYHAGMTGKKRTKIEEDWRNGISKVIIATIAFGMGIDKSDVRFVIHHNIPASIENYYQEIGRAGRDGKDSDCILYYSYADKIIWEKLLRSNEHGLKNTDYIYHQIDKLNDMCHYCENISDCRHCQFSTYLGETKNFTTEKCNFNCDNCLNSKNIINIDVSLLSKIILKIILNLNDSAFKSTIKYKLTKDPEYNTLKDKYGSVKNLFELYNRTVIYLIFNKYIKEILFKNNGNFWNEKYKLFSKANEIIKYDKNIEIPIINNSLILGNQNKKTNLNDNFNNNDIFDDKYKLSNLYQSLIIYRKQKSIEKKIPCYCILNNDIIRNIVLIKPSTKDSLYQIKGLGKIKIDYYGKDILDMVDNSN